MDKGLEVHVRTSPIKNTLMITANFNNELERIAPELILDRVAQAIADRYVEENYPAIAAKLNVDAVANLALVRAARHVIEDLGLTGNSRPQDHRVGR